MFLGLALHPVFEDCGYADHFTGLRLCLIISASGQQLMGPVVQQDFCH